MHRGAHACVWLVLLTLMLPTHTVSGEIDDASLYLGELKDVHVFSTSCLDNQTDCESTTPVHLLEYFSADWCEPCRNVSALVNDLQRNDTVVLQHHPSPMDESFLATSGERFDDEYRLLFLPSLVIDGAHLLTGSRQALDVQESLNNSTTQWDGLNELSFNGTTLNWNTSALGVVTVWHTTQTPHATENRTHPHLARTSFSANASQGEINLTLLQSEPGYLIVMLEKPGLRELSFASLAPTGGVDVNDPYLGDGEGLSQFSQQEIVFGTMVVLIGLWIPAFVMHRRHAPSKQLKSTHSESLVEEE
ncbi:MAG: hypothetical protein L7S56_00870 [Candidatus Poseidonia sp.]|nr:hypothetical protein [Poseidonia sp.]